MTCLSCGTDLPVGAMFCGECGRSVGSRPVRGVESVPEQPLTSHPESTQEADLEPELAMAASSGDVCAQCGQLWEESDIFCAECGFVRPRRAAAAGTNDPAAGPNDTAAVDRSHWLPVLPEISAVAESPVIPTMTSPDDTDFEDVEETRISLGSAAGTRFVLQFSTGESVTVSGTGMVGRHPVAEPGEHFDTFVTIVDPGKSVSKTHLEFGQEVGTFWLSDRFSGNGTVIREPDAHRRRCEPGKRYRIVRGTRVEIGDQFFIVS